MVCAIKREFNQKFEELFKLRDQKLDLILEQNKKMNEIYQELKETEELLPIKENLIANVASVTQLLPSEISFEKYLGREERERLEEAKRKEAERLRAINTDDLNVRALKMMMNNTLEEKKENALQKEAEKEDWMDKPKEEMNDEERAKLAAFLERQEQLRQEADKMKKMLH